MCEYKDTRDFLRKIYNHSLLYESLEDFRAFLVDEHDELVDVIEKIEEKLNSEE